MGKINKIQEQLNIAYGDNMFTTKIEDNAVVFDSTCDKFVFSDPINASINGIDFKVINGKAGFSTDGGATYYEIVKGDLLTVSVDGIDDGNSNGDPSDDFGA